MTRKTREALLHEVATLARLHGVGTGVARKIAHHTVALIESAAQRQRNRPSVVTEYAPAKREVRFIYKNWPGKPSREQAQADLDAFIAKRGLGTGYKLRGQRIGDSGGWLWIATSYVTGGTRAAALPMVLPSDPAAAIEMLLGQMSDSALASLTTDVASARAKKRVNQ